MSLSDESATGDLRVPAWHGPAFNPRQKFIAGVLSVSGGRLSFTTDDGLAFDVALAEIPPPEFGFGDSLMKCEADGKKWRFVFAKPQGANVAAAAGGIVGAAGGIAGSVSATKSIVDSRRVGKQLKQMVGSR